MGGRDVRRDQSRGGSRADGLWHRRGHHAIDVHVVRKTLMVKVLLVLLLALVAAPGVGVAVYPRVPGQLIGTRKLLAAARELAGMGLLARVSADVPGLMLQTVEGLFTKRALVGTRKLVGSLR